MTGERGIQPRIPSLAFLCRALRLPRVGLRLIAFAFVVDLTFVVGLAGIRFLLYVLHFVDVFHHPVFHIISGHTRWQSATLGGSSARRAAERSPADHKAKEDSKQSPNRTHYGILL